MRKKIIIEVAIILLITAFILIHEYLKEGYIFKPSDIFKFPSHESILIIVLIIYCLYKTVPYTVPWRVPYTVPHTVKKRKT